MTAWQWMSHPSTGGVQRFPVETVEHWLARGWECCDEPVVEDEALAPPAPVETAPPVVDPPPASPEPAPRSARKVNNDG